MQVKVSQNVFRPAVAERANGCLQRRLNYVLMEI